MGNVKVPNITRTPVENGSNWGSVAGTPPVTGLATPDLVFDGFESNDMSAPNSGGGVNTTGFNWESNNKTSVVYMKNGVTPTARYNNGPIDNENTTVPTLDWHPKNGINSLRFRFSANSEWTEQKYNAATPTEKLWVGYWLKVPDNFTRGLVQTGGGTNNKFFIMVWGDITNDYTDNNVARMGMTDRPNAAGTGINLDLAVRDQGGAATTSSSYTDFVTTADQGRWMHCMYYLGGGSSNESLRMWRRWENEASYTLIAGLDGRNIVDNVTSGHAGWSGGYLFGYANMPYAADTDWLVDDFSQWSADQTGGELII
jgi:hypothetical protein